MDTASQQVNWHYETLPNQTKKALDFLSGEKWLKESKWYLAGGTALALQVGNRKSVDLDFFTTQGNFEPIEVTDNFLNNKDWSPEINKKNTIYGKLLGAKMSFIAYPFFIPK